MTSAALRRQGQVQQTIAHIPAALVKALLLFAVPLAALPVRHWLDAYGSLFKGKVDDTITLRCCIHRPHRRCACRAGVLFECAANQRQLLL